MSNKTYTYDEVYKATLEYFKGDTLAAEVWINKYCMKDTDGNYVELTPTDMHWRMAKEFARIEDNYQLKEEDRHKLSEYGQKREKLTEQKIFDLFDKYTFIVPQGSVMNVLGNKYIFASLSNCIVLPKIYDSYGGICFADQQFAQLMKRRCGVGGDISTLRPEGFKVSNAAGTSTGAVSFLERYSNTTRETAQNGRRGAAILTIDIRHPDVEKFALIKQDLKKVTGANISIFLTDEFMKKLQEPDNKIKIELKDGNIEYLDKNEEIEIDGIVMLASKLEEYYETKKKDN